MKNNCIVKALLVTKGRKTQKEHAVWLRAVLYNDKVYFSRHRLDGDWIKNAIANPEVRVEYDNSSFLGKATLVSDESLSRKISELKYPGEERAKENRVVLEVSLS
jgi:hypothetical protein